MNNQKIQEAITLEQFPDRTHVNVMESLVAQEVERQRARLPENLARVSGSRALCRSTS